MKEKSNLAKVLKEASTANNDKGNAEGNIPQKGSWNFKVHFAWPVVLAALLKNQGTPGQVKKNTSKHLDFKDFWNEAVDSKRGPCAIYDSPLTLTRQSFRCVIIRSSEVLGPSVI